MVTNMTCQTKISFASTSRKTVSIFTALCLSTTQPTTYNLWHEQDTINPLTHADIMVLSHKDEQSHLYWYAHIIYIFHVFVQAHEDTWSCFSQPIQINILFVHWFGHDVNYLSGWSKKQLHWLQFFNCHNSFAEAFSFLNPNNVIQGVHLIPAFPFGTTDKLLGPLKAHQKSDSTPSGYHNWVYYFVNMYVFYLWTWI